MATKKQSERGQDDPVRVDLIDNDHDDWPKVLKSLDDRGASDALMLNDGYLSARQSLFVARAGAKVVGHLCFHVAPLAGKPQQPAGCVEARVDVLEVVPGLGEQEVKEMLVLAARKRASMLRCAKLVGFKAK